MFTPTLGKWSNLTNIFQVGWNHQLGMVILEKNLSEFVVDLDFAWGWMIQAEFLLRPWCQAIPCNLGSLESVFSCGWCLLSIHELHELLGPKHSNISNSNWLPIVGAAGSEKSPELYFYFA